MNKVKSTALLTALILCLSVLGACGSGGETALPASETQTGDSAPVEEAPAGSDATPVEETTVEAEAAANDEQPSANAGDYTDYSAGFPERVTLDIPVYDRAYEGWDLDDNYYTRWAQTEFGDKYNIDLNYVAIGRTTEVQDFTQMLSAGTAPTVIMHYDYPQALAYYGEGVMQELDWGEIQYYAPTVWEHTGSAVETYGTVNGEQVFFFAERPVADNFTHIIRKDWVEAAGFTVEEITSLEKLNEVLLKWKDMGLGTVNHRLVQNNYTYSYPYRDFPIDPTEHALYSELGVADMTTEATEAYLRNLNYQFNEGILDPEFYLRDDEVKEKAEFAAGRIGVVDTYMASNTDIFSSTLANDPNAEFDILPNTYNVPEGRQLQLRGYWPFGMIMGINYTATDEQRIAMFMYLEWLNQPEVLFQWQNGIDGETYNLNEEGLPVRVADYTGESAQSANNNKDYWCLATEGMRYDDEEMFWAANKLAWAPPEYEELADKVISNYREAIPSLIPDAMFTVTIESVAEYKADLNELWKQQYVNVVTSPVDQFDAAYQEACELFLSSGYQEIIDEKQAAIDAGNYIP